MWVIDGYNIKLKRVAVLAVVARYEYVGSILATVDREQWSNLSWTDKPKVVIQY